VRKQAAPRKKEPARTNALSARRVVNATTVAHARDVGASAVKTANAPLNPAQKCVRKHYPLPHPRLHLRAMVNPVREAVAVAAMADAANVANALKKQPAARW
jgi:hypothetical protein